MNINTLFLTNLVDNATKTSISAQALIAAAGSVTAATTATAGIVKMSVVQPASVATTIAGMVTDFNTLLANLKTAGLMSAV